MEKTDENELWNKFFIAAATGSWKYAITENLAAEDVAEFSRNVADEMLIKWRELEEV